MYTTIETAVWVTFYFVRVPVNYLDFDLEMRASMEYYRFFGGGIVTVSRMRDRDCWDGAVADGGYFYGPISPHGAIYGEVGELTATIGPRPQHVAR